MRMMKRLISIATTITFVSVCSVPYVTAAPIESKAHAAIVYTTSAKDVRTRLSHNVGQMSKAQRMAEQAENAQRNAENSKSSDMSFLWYILGGVAVLGGIVALVVAVGGGDEE